MFQSRLVLATSVAAVILSGCTANGIKPDGKHAYLSIHSPELTRLSSQASVEVVTETRDGKSLTHRFEGQVDLPIEYMLQTSPENIAEVTVSVFDHEQVVLKANKQKVITGINGLVLQADPQQSHQLANSYWSAEDISGRGIPPNVVTTLAFDTKGKMTGHAGCNHYRSDYRAQATFVEVEEAQLTRQKCAAAVMFHENRYLSILHDVENFKIDSQGVLNLYSKDYDQPIRFQPTTRKEVQYSMRAF